MGDSPKVSVIIPLYNAEKDLRKCMDSVVKQTLEDIEIICVNDASTDKTLEILNAYSNYDSRIKIISLKENVGVAYARKIGINNSNGEYFLFIDQDDWLKNNALELSYLNGKSNDSDIVFFDIRYYYQDLNKYSHIKTNDLSHFFPKDTDFNNTTFTYEKIKPHVLNRSCAPWFKLYKRSFMNSYDDFYFPKDFISHDVPLQIQILFRAKRISWCPHKLYYYRLSSYNTTSTVISGEKGIKEMFTLIDETESILKNSKKYVEFEYEFIEFVLKVCRVRLDLFNINIKEKSFLQIQKKLLDMDISKKIDNIPLTEKLFYQRVISSNSYLEFLNDEKNRYLKDINSLKNELNKEKAKYSETNQKLQTMQIQVNSNQRSVIQKIISQFPSFFILGNFRKTGLKNAILTVKGYRAIKKNKLFDEDYYLKNNSDVRLSSMDPLIHYIYYGYKEGIKPNPNFDNDKYLKKRPDVEKSNLNPLIHYSLYGLKENQKKELSTVPQYENLKLTLKGKEDYLFLINDSNCEIKQHFDQHYKNNFNANLFLEDLRSKREYLQKNGIKYFFFIVPDKSYVCRDLLPFDVKIIKRNYNSIKHEVPDFSDKLEHHHYWKNDTHINFLGGKELSYHILNYIDPNFTRNDLERLIKEQIISRDDYKHDGDLIHEINWSYPEEEKKKYSKEDTIHLRHGYLNDLKETLSEQFKFNFERETEYFLNEDGFTNLRVLILRDSTTNNLKNILAVYFREILIYWDHWFFNKELIEWYKPDIVLEIKTERLLENMEIYKKTRLINTNDL